MDNPQQTVSCPACNSALVSMLPAWQQVTTGRRWSDGYLETALLADSNWRKLVACPNCNFIEHRRAFEQSANTAVGELNANLPVEEYFSWLKSQVDLDLDIELSLRIEAWQIGNHERRRKIIRGPELEKEPPAEYNDDEKDNMRRILTLIKDDTAPARHLLRAELHRQLEEWKQAQQSARALRGNALEAFGLEIYRFTLERSPWPEPFRVQRVSLPILIS